MSTQNQSFQNDESAARTGQLIPSHLTRHVRFVCALAVFASVSGCGSGVLGEGDQSATLDGTLSDRASDTAEEALPSFAMATVDLTGELRVAIDDDFENAREARRIFLVDKMHRKPLRLNVSESLAAQIRSGISATVKGVIRNDIVDVTDISLHEASGEVVVSPSRYFEVAPVLGVQKTAILLVKANDATITTISRDDYKVNVADAADLQIRQSSYGQASINPDVFGWFSMGVASPFDVTGTPGACVDHIQTQLANAGIDLSQYEKVVCAIWGVGGGTGYWPGNYSNAGVSETSTTGTIKTLVHELGHNFGLDHAAEAYCQKDLGACEQNSVGDATDVMGYGQNYGYYNPAYKERLGWFDTAVGKVYRQVVTSSGIYTIQRYTAGAHAPEVLKVLVAQAGGNALTYYISHRRGIGFDQLLTQDSLFQMAPTVHMGLDNSTASNLLGTENKVRAGPFGPGFWPIAPFYISGGTNRSLAPGKVYRDASNKVSFKTISMNETYAQIEILFGDIHPQFKDVKVDGQTLSFEVRAC